MLPHRTFVEEGTAAEDAAGELHQWTAEVGALDRVRHARGARREQEEETEQGRAFRRTEYRTADPVHAAEKQGTRDPVGDHAGHRDP